MPRRLHTLAGRIVDCNSAAREMFGYYKSKMLSLNVSALVPAATESLQEEMRLCLEAAVAVSGLDCGGIYVLERQTGDLVLAYSVGL